jgi:hypothetical protein
MNNPAAILTLALFVSGFSWTDPADAAKACSLKTVSGVPKSAAGEPGARKMARQDWKNRVAASLGPIWSNWNVADDRAISCRGKAAGVECRAVATPCKELGFVGDRPDGSRFQLVR